MGEFPAGNRVLTDYTMRNGMWTTRVCVVGGWLRPRPLSVAVAVMAATVAVAATATAASVAAAGAASRRIPSC